MSSTSGGSSTGSCTSVSELRSPSEQDNSTAVNDLLPDDDFDAAIEESMELLEKEKIALESCEEDEDELKQMRPSGHSSGATTPSTEEEALQTPLSEEDIDRKLALFNQHVQSRSPLSHAANLHVSFPMPPPPPLPPIRFDRYSVCTRRRLSQCKEEENEEEESGAVNSALVAMRKSTSVNEESLQGGENELVPEEPSKAPQVSRFIVTKTEHKEEEEKKEEPKSPKPEVQLRSGLEAFLSRSSARQNAQTIHFPCSTPVQNRVSVQSMFEPHLDKRYFDTSLVEIRSMNDSSQTVNEEDSILNDSVDGKGSNEIWVKRNDNSADVSEGR